MLDLVCCVAEAEVDTAGTWGSGSESGNSFIVYQVPLLQSRTQRDQKAFRGLEYCFAYLHL